MSDNSSFQMDALPLGSNGKSNAMKPETRNNAPATYIGTAVARFAYRAMIGACSNRYGQLAGLQVDPRAITDVP